MSFTVKIKDDVGLAQALWRFPRKVKQYLVRAGKEAASGEVLPTPGLRTYPPLTDANQPGRTYETGEPMGYYHRGYGWMYPVKGGYKLRATSERLGTQWYVTADPTGYKTEIGVSDRASYAPWVHGDEQAQLMAKYKWRKLTDVVAEKIGRITEVYNAWIAKLLRDVGIR